MGVWTGGLLPLVWALAIGCGSKDDTADTDAGTDSDAPTTSGEDQPPKALDDEDTTYSGAPAVTDVIRNDTDPEAKKLKIDSVEAPDDGGTTEVISDTEVKYTPAAGFTGVAAFSYTVIDKGDNTDRGIVRVTVLDPPTITITGADPGTEVEERVTVRLAFEVSGCTVGDPDRDYEGCHLHKFVDGVEWTNGGGAEHFGLGDVGFPGLSAGDHILELQLAVNDGTDNLFDPPIRATQTVTVTPEGTTGGTTETAVTDTAIEAIDDTSVGVDDTSVVLDTSATDTGTTDTGMTDTGLTTAVP